MGTLNQIIVNMRLRKPANRFVEWIYNQIGYMIQQIYSNTRTNIIPRKWYFLLSWRITQVNINSCF
mgnify:CR=1 FL=1